MSSFFEKEDNGKSAGMPELKQYTRAEVERDNKKQGTTLFILHDKVYNVTSFLNEHPGGEEVLLDHGGKDASEDFDDVGHSKDAFDLITKYQVGELVESERRNIPPKKGWIAGYNSKVPEKYVQGPGMPFYLLLAGLIAIVAIAYYVQS